MKHNCLSIFFNNIQVMQKMTVRIKNSTRNETFWIKKKEQKLMNTTRFEYEIHVNYCQNFCLINNLGWELNFKGWVIGWCAFLE